MDTISFIIAITSLGFSFYTFFRSARREKKRDTLEAYNRLQSEVFDKLNAYTPAEIRDICADNKSHEYKTLSGYLARIEHFCVGLEQGIYDKKVFSALSDGYFNGYQLRKRIEPLLDSKNKSKNGKKQYYSATRSILAKTGEKEAKK